MARDDTCSPWCCGRCQIDPCRRKTDPPPDRHKPSTGSGSQGISYWVSDFSATGSIRRIKAVSLEKDLRPWDGRILVNANNAVEIPSYQAVDLGGRVSSRAVAEWAPGARVVKAIHLCWMPILKPRAGAACYLSRAKSRCEENHQRSRQALGLCRCRPGRRI